MLSPHDRDSLFAALRPPPGFHLDAAVGTSFTLDLEAMLTAPISFALYEATHADPDSPEVEPVGLLEAIRRHAERITLFCQAGQIAVPHRRRPVFAWLEDGVVEVTAPRSGHLFHPKIWVIRFRSDDTSVLRVLCATRNLTFDTSWDTLLRLESEPYTTADNTSLAGQRELADLLRALPGLAHQPVTAPRREAIEQLATEVERVPLAPPAPFTSVAFHAFGLARKRALPFPSTSSAAMVVSPFLGESLLARLLDDHTLDALVSREESMDRIPPDVLARAKRCYALNDAIDIDPPESANADDGEPAANVGSVDAHADPGRQLSGLHAKLFVFDIDDGTQLFTGSANATGAAFDGNVEVLAELQGPEEVGVQALLADTPGESGFLDLLIDYHLRDTPVEPDDTDELEWRLNRLRVDFASAWFIAQITGGPDEYQLRLSADVPAPTADADELEMTVWPVTLDENSSARLIAPDGPVEATFTVTLDGLSAFFAVRATARRGTARATTTFLVKAQLVGAPDDRHSRLLASMLRDRDRLLRYLLMLLHDETGGLEGEGRGQGKGWIGRWLGAGWDELPLLEVLLRALDRHPDRLDHIDRLLLDLGEERTDLLPEDFDAVWEPIWHHRLEAQR